MRWNWQNLNERRAGADGRRPKGIPWHGRAWLYLAERITLRLEWHLLSRSCGASVSVENELKLHLAFPPFSFWFAIEAPVFWREYGQSRALRLDVHDWAIWWNIWTDPHSWSSETPRYRNGAFHILDFLLGRHRYSSRPLACEWVEVPMPERTYYGVARLEEASRSRARWFTRRILRVEVKMLPGEQVPHPGKGENSWDCGQDATYSIVMPATSIEEGVAGLVGSVLRSRRKYGGRGWRPEAEAAE